VAIPGRSTRRCNSFSTGSNGMAKMPTPGTPRSQTCVMGCPKLTSLIPGASLVFADSLIDRAASR